MLYCWFCLFFLVFFFLGGGATSQIKGGYVKYDKYCSAVDGSDVLNTLNQTCSLGERERERDRQTDRQTDIEREMLVVKLMKCLYLLIPFWSVCQQNEVEPEQPHYRFLRTRRSMVKVNAAKRGLRSKPSLGFLLVVNLQICHVTH